MHSVTCDFAVIGAGIAGASIAAELSQQANVILFEKESQPGYHSTGRSAAMYIPSYGPLPIQALTKASGDFFNNPPQAFGNTPLLSPRSELLIARDDQLSVLDQFAVEYSGNEDISTLSTKEVIERCPILKPGYAAAGILDSSGSDINVDALHQYYLSHFKSNGGQLSVKTEIQSLKQRAGTWQIGTDNGDYIARTIINAAGAWCDHIGTLAGAEPIGLIPKRRTAMTITVSDFPGFDNMPLTADIEELFYCKPDAGNLLISPANENPSPPCDVQPEELDIAQCIDRIETAFELDVTTIVSKWAGLRSFVDDKCPVVGYSHKINNFFWLAGQGGYGIQSSPALAKLASALALNEPPPPDILRFGLNTESISVDRLHSS